MCDQIIETMKEHTRRMCKLKDDAFGMGMDDTSEVTADAMVV